MRTVIPNASRMDRLIQERVHDPYKSKHKPAEPSVCKGCHAVFHDGRWQRIESWPLHSHQVLCQACQRTRDHYPAGIVTLKGGFVQSHKDELLALARHHEQDENARHVLHRIMGVVEGPSAG